MRLGPRSCSRMGRSLAVRRHMRCFTFAARGRRTFAATRRRCMRRSSCCGFAACCGRRMSFRCAGRRCVGCRFMGCGCRLVTGCRCMSCRFMRRRPRLGPRSLCTASRSACRGFASACSFASRRFARRFVCRSAGSRGFLRVRDRQSARMSAVHLGIRRVVGARFIHARLLGLRCRHMPSVHSSALSGRRAVRNSARTAVIAHVPAVLNRVLAHDGVVDIGVVNDGCVYARNSRVIAERTSPPHAAHKANAHVAEAVIHASVVAY